MLHRAASNVSDKAKSNKPKVGETLKNTQYAECDIMLEDHFAFDAEKMINMAVFNIIYALNE